MRNATSVLPTAILCLAAWSAQAADPRRAISLDGVWEIGEGTLQEAPAVFGSAVPVPGLVDMARPAFADVGVKSPRREAFWYARSFRIDGPIPAFALLKVHKAMFGCRAILNGTVLGERGASFTPGLFDARPAVREGENRIVLRVGASRESVRRPVPDGWDFEKVRFIPGIFDSVELILTGAPRIAEVQAVPDIQGKAVTVHVRAEGGGPGEVRLDVTVREAAGGKVVGRGSCDLPAGDGAARAGKTTIPIEDARLWSPEDPFLYGLEVRSSGDAFSTRFGLRSFRLDPATGRAVLNGRPYFLRGSNVTLYRFFEDGERGDRPWRAEWVRRLHRAFKGMGWNSLRYCIGFPPEAWYEIADEEGLLIQDEFPIWSVQPGGIDYEAGELAQEYAEWMRERWNHPCVVIWDSCNETISPATGEAIRRVRGLDISDRPWDNGWSPPVAPGDVSEQHPYHFGNPHFRISGLAGASGSAGWAPGKNAVIVNEYGWLWLNRNGTPTTLTRDLYRNLLGPDSTTEARRIAYARLLAAETEFWRGHRACAGVLHFCALGYSRPDGQTSDHWVDVEKLEWEPHFLSWVRDAFAPVGLMLDVWAEEQPAGKVLEAPIVAINDLPRGWRGTVRLRLLRGEEVLEERSRETTIPALGERRLAFSVAIPERTGGYRLEAALLDPEAAPVRSVRDFDVLTEEERQARYGIAAGRPASASSNLSRDGATSPAAAVDGNRGTRWSSEFSDPQWIAVDLGRPERIARVVLDWETACGKAYSIEVSSDGSTWKEVGSTEDGKGGSEEIRFAPVEARWVRMRGTRRGTAYGYSLWELRVYRD